MLRKLMKYEIKATGRTFLLMFSAILVLSVINRLLMSDSMSYITNSDNFVMPLIFGFMMFLYVIAIVGTILAVMILMVMRFYKNLLGDEGYLSFSLPVKTWQHLVSKMLVGSMWLVSGIITTLISVFIMLSHPDILSELWLMLDNFFNKFLPDIAPYLDYRFGIFVTEFLIALLICVVSAFLPLFTAIMIGQLWQKHRVLGAVIAYLGMGFVSQIVNSIATNSFISSDPTRILFYHDYYAVEEFFSALYSTANGGLLTFIIITLVFNAAYFFIANHLMKNRLNLE